MTTFRECLLPSGTVAGVLTWLATARLDQLALAAVFR
jgi:hypothetical protein